MSVSTEQQMVPVPDHPIAAPARRRRWPWWVGGFGFLGAAAALVVLTRDRHAVQIQTAEVTNGPIARRVLVTGTIEPLRMVEVGSQVSGTIASLAADFNERVRAGQELARLDQVSFQARLAEAEAGLAKAQADHLHRRAALDDAEGGGGDRGWWRARRDGVSRRAAERERQDDVARVLERTGEPLVAPGLFEQRGEPLLHPEGARRRSGPLPRAKRVSEGLERSRRHGPRLGIDQQQVERDRAGARPRQPPHHIRHDAAAPRPATDLANARIVDQDQDDGVRGRRGRAQSQAEIQELAFEGAYGVEPACPRIRETHDERRLLPGTGFTIEPGLYFDDFGVRSEINLVMKAREARVTGPRQDEILALL